MYQVNKMVNRPTKELILKLSGYGTPIIGDSMGRYNCMDSTIKPIHDGLHIAGPAFTVQTYRADNLLCHLAIERSEPGDILVIDACGFTETGMWGDLMSLMAKKKGIGGIVIDGGVRDKLSIIKMGFPVFARSISPMGGFKASPGSLNVPISCGGVSVNPGDIIIGDADGVAVIPYEKAQSILEKCEIAEQKENTIRKRIEEGETLFNILNLNGQIKALGLD